MGGALPTARRERRQAPLHSRTPRRALAKTVLVQAARAAANKRDSYHRAQYLRLKARRGPNKAVLAVAASMLTAAYHMLKYGVEYRDLGPLHFERDKQAQVARLLNRLKGLGVTVTVEPAA